MTVERYVPLIALLLSACSSTSGSGTHTSTSTQVASDALLRLVATASSGSPPQIEADVDVVNQSTSTAITIRAAQLGPTPGVRVTALKMDNGSAPFANDLPRTLKLLGQTTIAPGAVQTLRIGLVVSQKCQRMQHASPSVEIEYLRSGGTGSVRIVPQSPSRRPWLGALICPHRL